MLLSVYIVKFSTLIFLCDVFYHLSEDFIASFALWSLFLHRYKDFVNIKSHILVIYLPFKLYFITYKLHKGNICDSTLHRSNISLAGFM